MPAEPATTILEALLRLFRRREEGKDRRRDLTETERELALDHVPGERKPRQGAGIDDSHFVFDADGTPYCDNLDWQHALRWFAFTGAPPEFAQITGLIRRLDALDWRVLGFGLADLETLNQSELSAIGLNPTEIETLAHLSDLQGRGRFRLFRQYLLAECPHLEENIGAVSVETGEQERSSKRRRRAKRRKRTEPTAAGSMACEIIPDTSTLLVDPHAGDRDGEPAGADDDAPPPLTANQTLVIATMARVDPSRLLSAAKIEAEMDAHERLSARTIGPIVRWLIELDLAERPEGNRSGARLTMKGRRLAPKLAD